MESRTIFVALGILVSGLALAEAYTWTDENGVVHYSDRPHPGAREITLPEQTARWPSATTRRSDAASQNAAGADPNAPAQPFSYQSVEIATPSAEETLWNIEGVLNVTVNLTPGLQPGHQVRAYFDGSPRMVDGTSFRIEEVWRGVHNLQVEVLDETGKLMIRSMPNRFYVQQNSVL